MNTNKVTDPGSTYPSEISKDPLSEPTTSSRVDKLPNQDPNMKAAEADPAGTSNPVKMGSGSVSQGNVPVGKEGQHGAGESGGTKDDVEKKGVGEKIKEKLGR